MTPKDLPELVEALRTAVRQNSHDMLMTGEELRACEAALEAYALGARSTAAQPVEPIIPNGWVPLRMEWEPGYPEDVAFGPQRMMDRLKKWLDKHFAAVTAAASGDSTPPSASVVIAPMLTAEGLNAADLEALEAGTFDHQLGAPRPEPEAAGQGMPGLLKAMRWAYHSYYVDGYSNSDERDAYVSALEDDLPALFGQVDDLVALVGRLVRSLRKAAPGDALADGALDYLRRKGLNPSPLRAAGPPPAASQQADREAE